MGLSRNGGFCGGSRNGRGVHRVQSDEPTVEYAGKFCSWGTEGSKWYGGDEPKKERDQQGLTIDARRAWSHWRSRYSYWEGVNDVHIMSAQAPGRRHAAALTKPRITDRG